MADRESCNLVLVLDKHYVAEGLTLYLFYLLGQIKPFVDGGCYFSAGGKVGPLLAVGRMDVSPIDLAMPLLYRLLTNQYEGSGPEAELVIQSYVFRALSKGEKREMPAVSQLQFLYRRSEQSLSDTFVPVVGTDGERTYPAKGSPCRTKARGDQSPIVPASQCYDMRRKTPGANASSVSVELEWICQAIARAESNSEDSVSLIDIGRGQRTYCQGHGVASLRNKKGELCPTADSTIFQGKPRRHVC